MRLSFKREADSGAEQISLERSSHSASSCPDSAVVVVVFPDVALGVRVVVQVMLEDLLRFSSEHT